MPKYHFEIVDVFRLEDPVGVDCTNDVQAKTVAQDIAKQIAIDVVSDSDSDRNVVVINDNGDEIYKTPIKT